MAGAGKILIVVGVVLVVVGVVVWGLGRVGFRGMPGDIKYEGEHVRFYFPIVTCLIVSLLLTLGVWVWRWLSGK